MCVLQVLTGVARLVSGISQQSSRASVAIASRLAERLQSLAAQAGAEGGRDAGAAALAGQQLDACLQFAAMLAAAPGASTLPAALLLSLPTLLPLLRQPSSSTRRLALDLCGTLLPIAARLPSASTASAAAASTPDAEAAGEPAEAAGEPADLAADGGGAPQPVPQQGASEDYRQALLAAVVSRLNDKDATLRAKALGVLEKHARLAATCLGSGAGAEAGAGGALQSPLLSALCGR